MGSGSPGAGSMMPSAHPLPGFLTGLLAVRALSGLTWPKSPRGRACSRSCCRAWTAVPQRPWDTGEQVGEPEDTGAIDSMDPAWVLDGWWWGPSERELAEDEELREMLEVDGGTGAHRVTLGKGRDG